MGKCNVGEELMHCNGGNNGDTLGYYSSMSPELLGLWDMQQCTTGDDGSIVQCTEATSQSIQQDLVLESCETVVGYMAPATFTDESGCIENEGMHVLSANRLAFFPS